MSERPVLLQARCRQTFRSTASLCPERHGASCRGSPITRTSLKISFRTRTESAEDMLWLFIEKCHVLESEKHVCGDKKSSLEAKRGPGPSPFYLHVSRRLSSLCPSSIRRLSSRACHSTLRRTESHLLDRPWLCRVGGGLAGESRQVRAAMLTGTRPASEGETYRWPGVQCIGKGGRGSGCADCSFCLFKREVSVFGLGATIPKNGHPPDTAHSHVHEGRKREPARGYRRPVGENAASGLSGAAH